MFHGVYKKKPPHFIVSAHSMYYTLDSRGVFGSANNATCILSRGFCTLVLFIMKGREYSSVYQITSLKKKVCVLKLVMAWEAPLRRFSQIMLSGPYQTQLSVLMTSFSPLSLTHTHILSLSPGLLMARNAVAANHKKLSSHMRLPEMLRLREAHICKHCPYLPQCCLTHK